MNTTFDKIKYRIKNDPVLWVFTASFLICTIVFIVYVNHIKNNKRVTFKKMKNV